MFHAKRCSACGKTTWSGCGGHVDAVKATAPADRWCEGHAAEDKPSRLKFWR